VARREGHVFPEVERAVLWNALVCRLRGLRRYRAYVDQEIRPLWLGLAATNEMIAMLPEHALLMRKPFEVPGSPGWLYWQKLETDPVREFGIAAHWGGTPHQLIRAIHQDAAAREIAASHRMLAERNAELGQTDRWESERTCAGDGLAVVLGEKFGLSLCVEPTRVECHIASPDDPEYGEPADVKSTRIDVPLSEGVALDDDYWNRLERTASESLRRGIARMREMVESTDPPRRRPSSVRNAWADLDLLFDWLVLKARPAARTDRIRLRRLTHRLGVLVPGDLPRDDECEEAAWQHASP
jgi:hypothetical protein